MFDALQWAWLRVSSREGIRITIMIMIRNRRLRFEAVNAYEFQNTFLDVAALAKVRNPHGPATVAT